MAAKLPTFNPKETDAKPPVISAAADTYYTIAGRITGTGGVLRSQINFGAQKFSDLIAGHVRTQAEKNAGAWHRAMEGSVWGGGVTDAWLANVVEFNNKRDDLIDEWNKAVGGNFGKTKEGAGGAAGKSEAEVSNEFDTAVEAAAQAKLVEMNGKFDVIWKKLEKDGGERGDELREGPTPENLKALVESGALGWAGFNLWGNKSAVPVTADDGKRLAALLKMAQKNGKLPPGLAAELANLQAAADHAMWLQLNGGKLTKNELAYLKAFYDGIGGETKTVTNGDKMSLVRTGALFNLEKWFNEANLNDDQRWAFKRALGGGLLALSDEGIGGGFGMLPSDVRAEMNTEVPKWLQHEPGTVQDQWAAGLGLLAPVLVAANPNMHAGKRFSAEMILRSADYATSLAPRERGVLQDFMGVGLRNKEASAGILHGDYEHSAYGKNTNDYVMRQLFSARWEDKGMTASHLIDWIDDDMSSTDPATRKLAYQAGYDVFTTMTDVKDHGLGGTAFEHYLHGLDGPGNDRGTLGGRNPWVASAIGDIIGPRLGDTFASPTDGITNGLHGDKFTLDEATRIRIMELAMTDPDTADALGKTIYARAIGDAGGLDAWKFGTAGHHGTENGRLIGLLDASVDNLKGGTGPGLDGGTLSAQAAKDDARVVRWANMGAAVLKEVVVPIKGFNNATTKILFELAKTGPGIGNVEGYWTTGPADDGSGGPAVHQRYGPLHGQISESVVKGMLGDGLSEADVAKEVKQVGGGLKLDDIMTDGHPKDWEKIDPSKREYATEVWENLIQKQHKTDEYEKYLRDIGAMQSDTSGANQPSSK